MNKSMLVGAVLGAVGVTAGGAVATYSLVNKGPEYAQVTDVQPIKQQVKTPREVCKDVAVTRQAPVKDQHQIAGTVVGAIAGGLLGNQIGGGSGKKIATVFENPRFRGAQTGNAASPAAASRWRWRSDSGNARHAM